MDVALRGANRDAQRARDLLVGEAEHVAEEDDRALVGGEAAERAGEIAALLELRHQVGSAEWDLVIVDCAPTAETLRLLSLPEVMNWYIERIFPVERRVVKTLRPIVSKMTTLPIAGERVGRATLSRLARCLAVGMQSGVPIVQGLTVVADVVDNVYIAQRIEQMRDGVERGESLLRTAVAVGVFTPVVLQMIAVGEETGELDELLAEVGRMYEREVDYDIRTLSANIEPILTVAMGVMVLVLALGVFLPIWGLGKVMLAR